MQATPGGEEGQIRSAFAQAAWAFFHVIPAQAGIQGGSAEGPVFVALDPRLRGDDVVQDARRSSPRREPSPDDGRPLSPRVDRSEPWIPTFVGMTAERTVRVALDPRLRGDDGAGTARLCPWPPPPPCSLPCAVRTISRELVRPTAGAGPLPRFAVAERRLRVRSAGVVGDAAVSPL